MRAISDGYDEEARQRLGAAMKAARLSRNQSQAQAADLAGIALLTWGAAERAARQPTELTLLAIDRGLGWPAGTAVKVLAGGKPPRPRRADATTPPPGDPPPSTDKPLEQILAQQAVILDRLTSVAERLATIVERLDSRDGPR